MFDFKHTSLQQQTGHREHACSEIAQAIQQQKKLDGLTLALILSSALGFRLELSPDLVQQLVKPIGPSLGHHSSMRVVHDVGG